MEAGQAVARDYASWGARVGAILIDNLLTGVIAIGLGGAVGAAAGEGEAGLGFGVVLWWVGSIVYMVLCEGSERGQTIGKRLLGIRVRDDEGGRARYSQTFGRELLRFLFGVFWPLALLNGLWPLWDGKKQAIHDKAASTVVLRA